MKALLHLTPFGSLAGVIAKRPDQDIEFAYKSKIWRDKGIEFVRWTFEMTGDWNVYVEDIANRPMTDSMYDWWEMTELDDDLERGLWITTVEAQQE